MWLGETQRVTQLSALWGQQRPGFCLEARTIPRGPLVSEASFVSCIAVVVICRSAAALHSLDKLTPICKLVHPALGQAL